MRVPNVWRPTPQLLGEANAYSGSVSQWVAPGASLANHGMAGVVSLGGAACYATIDGVPVVWCDGSSGTLVELGSAFGDGDSVCVTVWAWRPPGGVMMFGRGVNWSLILQAEDTLVSLQAVTNGQQYGTVIYEPQPAGWVCYTAMWHQNTAQYVYRDGRRIGSASLGGGFRAGSYGPRLGSHQGESYGPCGYAICATYGVPVDEANKDEFAARIYRVTSRLRFESLGFAVVAPNVIAADAIDSGDATGWAAIVAVGGVEARSGAGATGQADVVGVAASLGESAAAPTSLGETAALAAVDGIEAQTSAGHGAATGVASVAAGEAAPDVAWASIAIVAATFAEDLVGGIAAGAPLALAALGATSSANPAATGTGLGLGVVDAVSTGAAADWAGQPSFTVVLSIAASMSSPDLAASMSSPSVLCAASSPAIAVTFGEGP